MYGEGHSREKEAGKLCEACALAKRVHDFHVYDLPSPCCLGCMTIRGMTSLGVGRSVPACGRVYACVHMECSATLTAGLKLLAAQRGSAIGFAPRGPPAAARQEGPVATAMVTAVWPAALAAARRPSAAQNQTRRTQFWRGWVPPSAHTLGPACTPMHARQRRWLSGEGGVPGCMLLRSMPSNCAAYTTNPSQAVPSVAAAFPCTTRMTDHPCQPLDRGQLDKQHT